MQVLGLHPGWKTANDFVLVCLSFGCFSQTIAQSKQENDAEVNSLIISKPFISQVTALDIPTA